MFYMQHMTDAEFIRHLEGGNHSSKEIQALLERLRKAQDVIAELMPAQSILDDLNHPEVSRAVVQKDGVEYVALYHCGDWDAARQMFEADGYTDREPLFWAAQFITPYEQQLAVAAYPKVVYRAIDVWGRLIDQQIGQADAKTDTKPKLRTRTRNANTAKPAEQSNAPRRRTRPVR